MLPVAAAMPVPATTPMVWATAAMPPIRPRRSAGTWSGIIAVTAASIALSVACTPHHASTITGTFGATDRTTSDSAPPRAPPTSHGSRRPARSVVRSEKAPATGLQMTDTRAPRPVTRASTCSLSAESSASACWASSTWIGPKKPAHSPTLANASSATHRLGGTMGGSGSAAGGGVTGGSWQRSPLAWPTMSAIEGVSETFDPDAWDDVRGFDDLTDLTYHRARTHGTVRIAFDRPDVLNAFRPHTVDELLRVLEHARTSSDVGCVLLTGNGPSARNGKWAFCTGGDQRIRGRTGYQYADGETGDSVDKARLGRLHILECQRLIRFMPKVVVCLVNGWAAGGGHSLHVVADLTLASAEHARFKQTDADVGSFDGGFGSAYLARQVGQKFAREIFFLGRPYTAEQMHAMGAVNEVVDHAELESVGLEWAAAINGKSPQAIRMLKYAFNLTDDGLVGQQLFAGEATRLAYMTDEAVEGRDAFLQKRDPDWTQFPRYF